MKNWKPLFVFTILQLVFTLTLFGQSNQLPFDPNVKIGTLPNGIKYYIKHNKKPENRAELRLAIDAGSMQEDEDQLGVAHFVEHMAFNGTKHFKKNELVDYLELVGTRFGPDLNAYTSFDETVYMLQARTDSLALLEKGLLILEDWASGLNFDPEEIDKERGVVTSEWRSSLSPDQRLQQKYFPIIYQGSRYAKRLPIGKPEIIETVKYETIKRFYEDWYRPELMAVVAVGDFDIEWMEKEIIRRFSKVTNTKPARKKESNVIPKHANTRFAIFTDKEAPFTQVRVLYKHDRKKVKNIEDYQASLTRSLYNRMLNARMVELQQQAEPPFTFAYSGYGGDVGELDNYYVFAFVQEGQIEKGLSAVMQETRRALLYGFNETELERQKLEMMRGAEKAFKERDKTKSNNLAMRCVYHYLNGSQLMDAEQVLKLYKDLLPKIKVEQINTLAKDWITKENRTVVVTGPDKEGVELPDEKSLLRILDEVDQAELNPYVDKISKAPLLNKKLLPKNITGEKTFEELGVTELTLENGVKVVLKPTDFKNDEITMTAFSPGGHSMYEDVDYQSASIAAAIINQSGIGDFDLVAFQKMLTGKTVSVGPNIGELYEGINGNCSPDDIETMFQLIYLYFTAPRKDETALKSLISRQKAVYQNMMANPYYFFAQEKSKIKYNSHPRRQIPTLEDLENISMDKAFEVYTDRFADASDFTFVFVGAFQLEAIKPYLQKYLGNLPATGRKETWSNIKANLVKGKIDTTIVKGQAPKALVEMVFHGDFDYYGPNNRYNFYSLMDLLRIKMRESMREDKGGVYGVRVNGFVSPFPEETYTITISFNSQPEKAEELITTALNDIKTAQENGAEEKDINKIKETQLQNRIKNRKENSFWKGQLNSRYRYNLGLDGMKTGVYENLVENLNSNALQDAAKKYFDLNNFIKIVLMPETKIDK